MRSLIAVLFVFLSTAARAQTLLISDVDDTIKLANVHNLVDAGAYSFDEQSRFMGMSELYRILQKEVTDISFVYLSKAPTWYMQGTHTRFLKNGGFPMGLYIGRSNLESEVHKLINIRRLINKNKPRKVILIGDDGEQDAQVYAQIQKEYRSQGIEIYQFIRIIFPGKVYAGQIGFVTPIEIALELEKEHLLSSPTVDALINTVGKNIVSAPMSASSGVVAFPNFLDCSDFRWQWDDSLSRSTVMPQLKAKLARRCQ